MSFSIASGLVLVFASLISKAVPSEVLNGLDEQELSSIAYRLQDEKQQRLILKNDVDVMMLKIGLMERSIEEIKKSKPQPGKCPSDWKRQGQNCYYFGQELLSWQDAACRGLGGHLADITSAAENEYVIEGAKESGGLHWIDGTDSFSEGEWIWVTRMQRIGRLTFWNEGQPDNSYRGSQEHCLEINHGSGGWNDRPCSYKEKFICEIEI